jgi:integrase/recombinase XerD
MFAVNDIKISNFRAHMATHGKQRSTIESYGRDLENFLKFLELERIDSRDIGLKTLEDFKNWLVQKGSKHSSIRRAIISIRMFFRWAEDCDDLHGNPFEEAPVPAHEYCRAREISSDLIDQIVIKCNLSDSILKCRRDQLLFHLLSKEGLKASEVISLEWHHFLGSNESGKLSIFGDRARTISLEAQTTSYFKSYREALQNDSRTSLNFSSKAPVFISFKGADARSVQYGLTRHGIKFAIYELGEAVGLSKLNAEQLRHAAMSHKISLGFTPEMLMNHLGLRRLGNIGKHLSES